MSGFSHHLANVQEHTAERQLRKMLAQFYLHFGKALVDEAIANYQEDVRIKEEAEKE